MKPIRKSSLQSLLNDKPFGNTAACSHSLGNQRKVDSADSLMLSRFSYLPQVVISRLLISATRPAD